MDTLFKYASGVALALFAAGLTSCSKSDETAGGVTDIGNSIASGIVVTEANQPVARARVVAYYDNWDKTSIEDSVVVEADNNGIFSLKFDSTRSVVIYAENGSESGLLPRPSPVTCALWAVAKSLPSIPMARLHLNPCPWAKSRWCMWLAIGHRPVSTS